jgi:phosphate transport system substrate-binding protein
VLKHRWLALALAGALATAAAGCGSSNKSPGTAGSGSSSSGSVTLNGAGSTLAAPIYQQWGSDLGGQGVTVNYQPVGSGAGVSQLQAGTVDFAGTDPPLKDDEVKAAAQHGIPVHVPTAFGAITVSYNLSGVKSGLKLDGKTIADIFLGKVKKWSDPEITALNSGVSLPSTAITVVHRSDSSGTTKGFTTFLSDYSAEWKSKVGADKDVKWPTGTGAAKNAGVAAAIKQTDGAIGYVEQAYALQNNFTYASVKNKSGAFVAPTLQSTTAAGSGITLPADLRFTAIDSPNAAAYPIVSQTFIVVYKDLCKAGLSQAKAAGIKKLLDYGLSSAGQASAQKLSYAPLPSGLLAKAKAAVASLTCNGAAVAG